jgi:hypothetical protein
LDGLVLKSKIYPHCIATDKRVIEFAQREIDDQLLEQILEKEKYRSWANHLIRLFDFSKLAVAIHHWLQHLEDKPSAYLSSALPVAQTATIRVDELLEVGRKFQKQLHVIFQPVLEGSDTGQLQERMTKGVRYFSDLIANELLAPVQAHLKSIQFATRVKKYKEEITGLETLIWQHVQRLQNSRYGDIRFSDNMAAYEAFSPGIIEKKISKTTKPEKGNSLKETLKLFQEGKDIEEIMSLRNLAHSTVVGHLAFYISNGDLSINQMMDVQKQKEITTVIGQIGEQSIGAIKSRLGDEYTYGDIRLVLSHLSWLKTSKAIAE